MTDDSTGEIPQPELSEAMDLDVTHAEMDWSEEHWLCKRNAQGWQCYGAFPVRSGWSESTTECERTKEGEECDGGADRIQSAFNLGVRSA